MTDTESIERIVAANGDTAERLLQACGELSAAANKLAPSQYASNSAAVTLNGGGILAAVLAVVYLIFNEGYSGRGDLNEEALRLGRSLVELMPDEPEAVGLLALLLLTLSRRPARFDDAGDLVLLPDQDRSLWDRALIDEGIISGLSIGFRALECSAPDAGEIAKYGMRCNRVIRKSMLLEYSVTAMPCNPEATLKMLDLVAKSRVSKRTADMLSMPSPPSRRSMSNHVVIPAASSPALSFCTAARSSRA